MYTKKQIEKIVANMEIIVDSREKKNSHITKVFDECNIKHFTKGLKFGDYSFCIRDMPEINQEEFSFENRIVVERKNSLDELANNITTNRKNRERFEKELQKAKDQNCKLFLLIENYSYEDILRHNYRSKMLPKSYIATLLTYVSRYNINIIFMNQVCSANYIYNLFKRHLVESIEE